MPGTSVASLRQIGPEIWVADRALSLRVGNLGARMTVVRLRSGGLFVHSPVLPDEPTCRALRELGPVVAVVAPNKTHHFFIRRFHQAFPEAQVWGAPGLSEKRSDLPLNHVLSDHSPELWKADLLQRHVRGIPVLEEVAFLHPRSRTLILADLAFNFSADSQVDRRARLFLWLNGAWGHFGPHRLVRMLIRDRGAFAESLRHVLSWDFERVVVSHGHIVANGGKEAVRQAFSPWL